MTSIYVVCDECCATFDGEAFDPRGDYHINGHRDASALREEAHAKGWIGPMDWSIQWSLVPHDPDLCPSCASKRSTKE
jgi:hypothetical protein